MNLRVALNKFLNNRLAVNVSKGFFWQGLGILCTLVSLPISIKYLGLYNYGIWITVYGTILWLGSFDLGVANGMRNELATSFAHKDTLKSRYIVTNAYYSIFFILCFLVLTGLVLNHIFSGGHLLKISYTHEIFRLVNILVLFFGTETILKLAGIIYTSDQRSSIVPLMSGINNALILLVVFILETGQITLYGSRLITYGILIGMIPSVSNGLLTLFSFASGYRHLLPRLKYRDLSWMKRLLRTGILFFGIQVSMVFLLQLSNLLVSAWSSPSAVSLINIADKYFLVLSIIGTIVLFPFWSAFTAADERREHAWVKSTLRKLEKMFLVLAASGLLLLLAFPFIVKIWFKNTITVPYLFAIIIYLKYIFIVLNSIYSIYLNGIGKIRLQLLLYLSFAILNVPASYLLFKLFGTFGIILFLPFAMLIMAIAQRRYAYTLLKEKLEKRVASSE